MELSIIIINFNSSSFTLKCIESIKELHRDLSYEIIIIDNDSSLEDFTYLESNITISDHIILRRSKKNLGFGGGNDFGFQFASGKYLAFVNNDVEFIENSLEVLLIFLKNDPKIGVIGGRQVNSERDFFRYSFRNFHFIKQIFGEKNPIKQYQAELEKGVPFSVDLVSGALMIFRTTAYKEAKGFDTNIFLFYEEMDICLRLKRLNYKTVYHPGTSYVHYMGQSSPSKGIREEFLISYLYVIQKHTSYFYYNTVRVLLLLKYGFKSIIKPQKYFGLFKIMLIGGNSLARSLKLK